MAQNKTVTLNIDLSKNKRLFIDDNVHLFIQDQMIDITGTIPEYFLQQTVGIRRRTDCLLLTKVSDEQIDSFKKQMVEVVRPTSIVESGRMLFSDVISSTDYKRLKALIVYRNAIYQINSITIIKREDESYSIVFGIVR